MKKNIPDFASVSASYGDAVGTCHALGLITGIDSAGSFSPKGRTTRAQTAGIYARLKQVMETGEGIAPAQTGASAETSSGTLTNGKPVTEENVLALIEEYKNGTRLPGEKARAAGVTWYEDCTYYPADNPKYYLALFGNGNDCAKFAFAFWDDLFGDVPMRTISDVSNVRPGDLLYFDTHWAIATEHASAHSFIMSGEKICATNAGGGSSDIIGRA